METQLKQHGQQVAPSWAGGSALPMQCLTSLAWHGLSCPKPQMQDGGFAVMTS